MKYTPLIPVAVSSILVRSSVLAQGAGDVLRPAGFVPLGMSQPDAEFIVDTPLHKNNLKDFFKTLSPMHSVSSIGDIVQAVVFRTDSPRLTREVPPVDGSAHLGKW
jgi:hypothetical protein